MASNEFRETKPLSSLLVVPMALSDLFLKYHIPYNFAMY